MSEHRGAGSPQDVLPGLAARSAASFTTAELWGPPPASATPHPREIDGLGPVGASRLDDFTRGRYCARRALLGAGAEPGPLLRAAGGSPQWPAGFTGSITHCRGFAAAVAGRQDTVLALGVDAEPDRPLPVGVLDAVARPAEREMLDRLAVAGPTHCWDRMLFAAKEAVYKAWSSSTGLWLNFHDAAVTFDIESRSFTAHVPGAPEDALRTMAGRFVAERGIVVALVVIACHPLAQMSPPPASSGSAAACAS